MEIYSLTLFWIELLCIAHYDSSGSFPCCKTAADGVLNRSPPADLTAPAELDKAAVGAGGVGRSGQTQVGKGRS